MICANIIYIDGNSGEQIYKTTVDAVRLQGSSGLTHIVPRKGETVNFGRESPDVDPQFYGIYEVDSIDYDITGHIVFIDVKRTSN